MKNNMVLDIKNIKQLRSFILDVPNQEEKDTCMICNCETENIKNICKYKEVCEEWSPVMFTEKLVTDLFDTIEYLLAEKVIK